MGIDDAYNLAVSSLNGGDPGGICSRCRVKFDSKTYTLSYFGRKISIILPEARFEPSGISPMEQILVIHYLVSRDNKPAKGEWLSYKALPGGHFYYTAYRRLGENRLLGMFGDKPDSLLAAGKALGYKPASMGDISFLIPVFPCVEIMLVFHNGDDEFPPDLQFLYMDDILNYLTLDDISKLSLVTALRFRPK
ncbi:MAG: DUF3786 domain-containing protein [Spirochaetales bacterium]|nr:DUF3786 domain-containing protein [Spirochaetales bacterium]